MSPDVFIVGEIDSESTKEIIEKLYAMRKKSINVFLASEGGDVTVTMGLVAAISALQQSGKAVNILAGGVAHSSGVIVLQSGSRRYLYPHSTIRIHQVYWEIKKPRIYTYSDLVGEMQAIQSVRESYFNILEHRTGRSAAFWRESLERLNNEWMIDAKTAVELGLADEIIPYSFPQGEPIDSGDASNLLRMEDYRTPA
jgi:ATP-dependent protease ClpP protease subunit